MSQSLTERLNAALADRYKIERHLGEGGMAISHQLSAISCQRSRGVPHMDQFHG